MAMEDAQKLKIILLGDSGVGKTSLINQYVNKRFQNKPILHFQAPLSKELEVNNKHVTLEIYDTGGREREGAPGLEATFYSDAKGCMLVYDVNDPKSLENLENWLNEFNTKVFSNRATSRSFPFIVLGNKADTDGGRNKEVYPETARKWCQSKGITHFLTSAKDNKSVAEAFEHVAQLALNHNTQEPPKPPPLVNGTQNGCNGDGHKPSIPPPTKPPHNPPSIPPSTTPTYPSIPHKPNGGTPPQSTQPTIPQKPNGQHNNDTGKPPKNNSCCTIL